MKQVVFFCCLLVGLSVFSQETELKWSQDFEKTLKKSKKNKKPIIMYFSGSDWCAPCKKLDADFFHSTEFLEKSSQLNLVLVDVPRRVDIISEKQMQINKELLKEYNPSKSFPMVVFMNYKGKVEEKIAGYSYLRDTSRYFKYVEELLK
ncbi:thioredoxin family protein [Ochrovirga pacifica]|uniref:thioredoxin family protein n=1 Tax=Ochrovirga pacifica TaxID=1042376 RepID=UPI000255A283|nr:thioredoxin fold domain-containing protein [Ochrovirga pacifica]